MTQVIFLASGNEKKLAELRTLCVDLPVDIVGPESLSHTLPEVEEDRLTFLGNAQKKALAAAQFIAEHLGPNVWALADDSGLCVDALDGNPGVFSARYSGILGAEQDSANNAHLLEQLKNTPKSKLYQLVADGPGRMAPPPFGDRIKMNGAYRHPALDARGVVCITEAARITTRDRPAARPLNAPSLLLFRRWRS